MSALIRQKNSDMKACFKSSAIKVKKNPWFLSEES